MITPFSAPISETIEYKAPPLGKRYPPGIRVRVGSGIERRPLFDGRRPHGVPDDAKQARFTLHTARV